MFVEPGASLRPVGGTRIVYEHANRLAERGHDVTVVLPASAAIDARLRKRLRLWLRWRRWKADGRWRPTWARISPKVKVLWAPDLSARHVPAGDVVVATVWNAVEGVDRLPPSHGVKAFFAQHWDFGFERNAEGVERAWAPAMAKIVIARSIRAKAAERGVDAALVPNGLELATFGLDTPLDQRDPFRVALIHQRASYKGFDDALAALAIAHAAEPRLTVEMYGPAAPDDLPAYVTYHVAPTDADLRALYNRASVFVSASHNEGWGLPPCEAALCGAALAITDNLGHREFAFDGRTALLSQPHDPPALAANLLALIADAELRARLNAGARAELAQYDWNRSSALMEEALTRIVAAG
ncbi:glycosyltransferase family 4 protein [Caulobacter hibisci]|uniref:glycosyltransferase family 4 protein n=1 Tax=Caulobacter hibisci TaxID=2035993 RepID=UPI002FCD729D